MDAAARSPPGTTGRSLPVASLERTGASLPAASVLSFASMTADVAQCVYVLYGDDAYIRDAHRREITDHVVGPIVIGLAKK